MDFTESEEGDNISSSQTRAFMNYCSSMHIFEEYVLGWAFSSYTCISWNNEGNKIVLFSRFTLNMFQCSAENTEKDPHAKPEV